MTKIAVADCPAGPALDAAVAKIRGDKKQWEWSCVLEGHWIDGDPETGWCYDCRRLVSEGKAMSALDRPVSRNIAAAWELIEAMGIKHSPSLYQIAKWYCNFMVEQKVPPQGYTVMRPLEASGITAPLAITRAFLLAHGVTEVEVADD